MHATRAEKLIVQCAALQMFVKLFLLAKLPTEMSPSQHRKIQPSMYLGVPGSEDASPAAGPGSGTAGPPSGPGGGSGTSPRSIRHRMVSLRRRLSDACGAVAVNARRPSIRTDLLTLQQVRRTLGGGQASSAAASATGVGGATADGKSETGSLAGDFVRNAKCSIQ